MLHFAFVLLHFLKHAKFVCSLIAWRTNEYYLYWKWVLGYVLYYFTYIYNFCSTSTIAYNPLRLLFVYVGVMVYFVSNAFYYLLINVIIIYKFKLTLNTQDFFLLYMASTILNFCIIMFRSKKLYVKKEVIKKIKIISLNFY